MKIEEITLDRKELEMAVRLLGVEDGLIGGTTFFEGSTSVWNVTSYGELKMTGTHGGMGVQTVAFKKTYNS